MIDKSDWGEGPWQHEPDQLDWVDAKTGLRCLIHRSWMGMWCGYVGVPASHPLYGLHYDDAAEAGIEAHGGLSWAAASTEDELWWFGFDCGHFLDFSPGLQANLPPHLRERYGGLQQEYRDLDFVRRECAGLAWQLHGLSETASRIPSLSGDGEG